MQLPGFVAYLSMCVYHDLCAAADATAPADENSHKRSHVRFFFAKSGSCNLNFQVFLCCHVAAAVVTDFRKFRHTRLINSLKTKFVKGVTVIGSVCTNNLSASLGLNPNWANQLDFFRAQCKRHNWYGFVCQWFAKVCLKRIKNTQKRPEPWLWWK